MTFCKFIELALYHNQYGYYISQPKSPGKGGDYFTSPSASSAFGQTVSNFLIKALDLIESPEPKIVEMGGGSGFFALDILNSIQEKRPELYKNLSYVLCEISEAKRRESTKLLEDHLDNIVFISALSTLSGQAINGIFISNEFVDSMPFHRCVYQRGKLQEIFVTFKDGQLEEAACELSDGSLKEYLDASSVKLADGQKVEINLNAARWLAETSEILNKGFVLTIDYGSLAETLFDPVRTDGTMKCFYKHTLSNNPYDHIGEQDITANVDFSNLIRTGNALGLETIKYDSQGQFLIDWGILESYGNEVNKSPEGSQIDQKKLSAIKTLFLPEMMGGRFKVLLQGKGIKERLGGFYPPSPFKLTPKLG